MMRRSKGDPLADFGVRIRNLRNAKGWTQEQLAEAAQLHPTYISGVERGLRNISLKNLRKVSRAFGVSLSALFKGLG